MKLLKNFNKKVLSVALATAMAFGFAAAPVPALLEVGQSVAYAEAHNVTSLPTPDALGQGGGPTDPFRYYHEKFSTIRPGDTDVPVNAMLLLAFNKNATSTRPRYDDPEDMIIVNADRIRLYKTSDLNTVIGSTKIVDQNLISSVYDTMYSERDYRNYILIEHDTLEPNTEYTIIIDPEVQAANGQIIGTANPDGFTVNFTTTN